jgi:HD superfamily phosphohydrolase
LVLRVHCASCPVSLLDFHYGFITIPNALIYDLQHPIQRLRRISQMGSYLVYPGANHTRITLWVVCI